jgi:nucleoside 2-deoxyribosyltransferase
MIYIAAPLFNPTERKFNSDLKRLIRHPTYLPQEDGRLMTDLLSGGMSLAEATKLIHESDLKAIEDCTLLVAILDGAHVDSGVAFEIGAAFVLHKPIIGFHSDFRTELSFGHNPMIAGSLDLIVSSLEDLIDAIDARQNRPWP